MKKLRSLSLSLATALAATSLLASGCASDPEPIEPRANELPPVKSKKSSSSASEKPAATDATASSSSSTDASSAGAASGTGSGAPSSGMGSMSLGGNSLAFPTGDPATSAILVRDVMPAEVRAGAPYDYELQVENLTNGTLQNVVLKTESTSNLQIINSDPPAANSADGGAMWSLGDLGPRQSRTIRVAARAETVGQSSNCVTVSYANVLCAATNVVEPALQLIKTGPAEVLKCDPITYNFEVRNPGTGSAANVRIRDELPAGLTTSDGKSTVDIDVGTLGAGQSATRSITVMAANTGTFENSATASADGGLTAASGTVTTVVRKPALTIAATCSGRIFLGRNATGTFVIRNTGDAACNGTTVTAPIPAGTSFVSASAGGTSSGGNVVWNVGVLGAGEERTVEMTVNPSAFGNIRFSATVACACSDPATDGCETDIQGIPAVLLEVVDLDDPIEVGKNETYVITVTNQGSAIDTNIAITCELPSEQEFVSAGGATSGTASGQTVTFAALPQLAAKAKAEWRLVVKARAEGDVRFKVTMNTDQLKGRPVEETEATNLYQ